MSKSILSGRRYVMMAAIVVVFVGVSSVAFAQQVQPINPYQTQTGQTDQTSNQSQKRNQIGSANTATTNNATTATTSNNTSRTSVSQTTRTSATTGTTTTQQSENDTFRVSFDIGTLILAPAETSDENPRIQNLTNPNITDVDKSTNRTGTRNATNNTTGARTSNTTTSTMIQQVEDTKPYLLSGAGSLNVRDGNVSSFSAAFDMVHTDGTDRHSHQIINFTQTGSSIKLSNGDAIIRGKSDVTKDGKVMWRGVDTIVMVDSMNVVSITLDNQDTNSHFRGQRILGVVSSLTDSRGNDLIESNLTANGAANGNQESVSTGSTSTSTGNGSTSTANGTSPANRSTSGSTSANRSNATTSGTTGSQNNDFFGGLAAAISDFFGGGNESNSQTSEGQTIGKTNTSTRTGSATNSAASTTNSTRSTSTGTNSSTSSESTNRSPATTTSTNTGTGLTTGR